MKDKIKPSRNNGLFALFSRILRAINYKPYSREEIQNLLQEPNGVIDPDEQEMLSGVLDVAETQVREVMVPKAKMTVINEGDSLDYGPTKTLQDTIIAKKLYETAKETGSGTWFDF